MKRIKFNSVEQSIEAKGSGIKTLWQLLKFAVAGGLATIVQLTTVNLFNIWMNGHFGTVNGFLSHIFSEQTMGFGNNNWGYVLPFLFSNLLAQIVGYIINRKTTFKSKTNLGASFTAYIIIILVLILFNTWLQGVLTGAIQVWCATQTTSFASTLNKLAVTIASMTIGFEQFIILFPLEKYVLLREKKEDNIALEI